jgi:hypothetical protein
VTVTGFPEARTTEDELAARTATDTAPDWLAHYDYRDVKDSDGHYIVQADGRHPSTAQAAHIARHDPPGCCATATPGGRSSPTSCAATRSATFPAAARSRTPSRPSPRCTPGTPDYDPAWA